MSNNTGRRVGDAERVEESNSKAVNLIESCWLYVRVKEVFTSETSQFPAD
jgi:hypothetical protein